jgi:FtsZ-interacting cell division protein ZipA
MVKANLITQLILAAVAFVIFFFVGLFAARDEKKKTKDGFQSDKMQSLYNHYLNKEMQYGKPGE